MYQLRETLIDNNPYSDEKKFFKNIAFLDFESICVQEDNFLDTDTTTWTDKHVPISVSTSSNLIEEPIVFCNSILGALVQTFNDALEALATQQSANETKVFGD